MLCDCDLRDMNLFVRLYRIEMEKRPIGTPCARGKHEMKFFRLVNYFRSIQIDSNRCFRSIVDGERWDGSGGGVSDLDRESCLHYFIFGNWIVGKFFAIEHTQSLFFRRILDL